MKRNPNSKSSVIFEQIKKYGPVTAIAVSNALGITTQRVQSAVGHLRTKNKVNIQKKGNKTRKETLEYFYDPEFPIIGAPSLTEQAEEKESDDLFEELVEGQDQIAPMQKPTPQKMTKGLDLLVNRCHHLVLALENCSSDIIQDTFNLDEEQARILMNKVVAKFGGMTVSFCIKVVKDK